MPQEARPESGLQTEFDPQRAIPAKLRLTTPEVNDRTAIKEWNLSDLHGWTLVFDLGYYAHAHFKRLLENEVSFLTRLQSQARYETLSQKGASAGERILEGDGRRPLRPDAHPGQPQQPHRRGAF